MVRDGVTAFSTLLVATFVMLLALHPLPLIPIDLTTLTWTEIREAAACAESDPAGCMLGP